MATSDDGGGVPVARIGPWEATDAFVFEGLIGDLGPKCRSLLTPPGPRFPPSFAVWSRWRTTARLHEVDWDVPTNLRKAVEQVAARRTSFRGTSPRFR